MQGRLAFSAIALSVIILLSSSVTNLKVQGVTQNGPTTWSPFGPREEDLTLNVYSDCTSMFNDFQAGKLDIGDWDLSSCGQNLAAYSANPDFFVTNLVPGAGQFAALNGWNFQGTSWPSASSLVSVANHGFQTGYGFWSLLNMRQVPGSQTSCLNGVPGSPPGCTVNGLFLPGGGDTELIRRGLTQPGTGLVTLNPFRASTPAELEVVSLVFDTMLRVTPAQDVIDWMATFHRSAFDPATNTTTQTWFLRNDLYFHDGFPVTSEDVCYTITAYRDVPSVHFGPAANPDIGNVVNCAFTQSTNIVQVILSGSRPSYDLSIGTLPIIPKHIWKPFCGDPPTVNSPCANKDTMNDQIFIGSGPWFCAGITVKFGIGGPCTSSLHDTVPGGGWVRLGRYDALVGMNSPNGPGYMRCCPNVQDQKGLSLQRLSWADIFDRGIVDIVDFSSLAISYGSSNAYWAHPLFGCGNTVDICDVAAAAQYYGNNLTCPACPPPTALTDIDPQIDPFRVDTSQFTLYYLGAKSIAGIFTLYLAVLAGTVPANSLTAQLSSDESHSWGVPTIGPGAPVTGSSTGPGLITLELTTVPCPAHYDLRLRFNASGSGATISSDWDHIELGQSC